MNTAQNRIDRSVNSLTKTIAMKHLNTLPSIPAEVTFTDLTLRQFSAACRSTMAQLKSKLVSRLSAEFGNIETRLIRQAVNEADALAALTIVPHLLLPSLAEEKVQNLHEWSVRQRAFLQRPVLGLAV